MAKVNIQPITIWVAGEQKTASAIKMRSIGDDLETSAQFYYELCEADTTDADGNLIVGAALTNGNLYMSGESYQDWGNQSGADINKWAYDWAIEKLNLTSSVI